MAGEGGVPDENFFVFEGGDAVADGFGGFLGNDGADGGPHFVHAAACGWLKGGKIFRDGFRFPGEFVGGSAFGGFCALHTRDAIRTSASRPCACLTSRLLLWQ